MSYVEFMTSQKKQSFVTGAQVLYLDDIKFRGDCPDEKVCEIFSKKLPNVDFPVPRPTRAHTFDFNMTHGGGRLLDEESKGSQLEHEKAILVFHSLDQLAFKDEALALMTMNNSFTFYNSWLVDGAAYVQT